MLNENVIKGKWNEIKGVVQNKWGKLTDDDLEEAKGSLSNLAGIIQKRYGLAQDEVRKNLDQVLAKFGSDEEEQSQPH